MRVSCRFLAAHHIERLDGGGVVLDVPLPEHLAELDLLVSRARL